MRACPNDNRQDADRRNEASRIARYDVVVQRADRQRQHAGYAI